jgi:hypothetical protein
MLFVSDSSKLCKMMPFGWVLSTPTGTRLAWCYGPASGPNTSYRAKATGMLATSRFLLRLSQFCDCHQKWHDRYVSDNQGLITRANDRLKYTHSYPNATLAPYWDLVEEIHTTNAILNATASYQHVLGHQDQHKQYEDLPLDAQLNVDADEEVGYFQSMHATVMRPAAPLLPSTKAQLHIGTQTITGHYPAAIRLVAKPILGAYIQERNEWEETHLDSILWPALRSSISRNSHRHVQVVKLLHGLLPTTKYCKKFDKSLNPECSLCHNGDKDWTHVLRCLTLPGKNGELNYSQPSD